MVDWSRISVKASFGPNEDGSEPLFVYNSGDHIDGDGTDAGFYQRVVASTSVVTIDTSTLAGIQQVIVVNRSSSNDVTVKWNDTANNGASPYQAVQIVEASGRAGSDVGRILVISDMFATDNLTVETAAGTATVDIVVLGDE